MPNNNIANVIPFIVREHDGTINLSASVDNFHSQLEMYRKTHRTALKRVASAVNSVFDEHRGTSFNLSAIQGFALTKLQATPDNWDELSELVAEYVRSDPNFEIRKGRGGGVRRKSDVEAAAAAESEDVEDEDDDQDEVPPAPLPAQVASTARRQSSNPPRISTVPPRNSSRPPSSRAASR